MVRGFTSLLFGFHHLLLPETLRHSGRLILLIVLSHFELVIGINHVTENMHIDVSIIVC